MTTDTTYLLGLGGSGPDPGSPAGLRIGARLRLRSPPPAAPRAGGRGRVVEVRARDGHLLGQLPPDDARAIAELLDAGLSATARVSALVPAFRRQRVQLAIEVGPMSGDPGATEGGHPGRGLRG